MAEEDRRRGILLAATAASLQACFLIPYKIALEHAPNDAAVISLLFFAAMFNSSLLVGTRIKAGPEPAAAPKGERWTITLFVIGALSVLSVVGNDTAGEAVVRLSPAVASVLLQTQVLFVSVVGVFVLGEKVSARFMVGAAIALCGVATMRIGGSENAHDTHEALVGTAWGLASAFSFGMVQVVTRKYIHRIRPVLVNTARLWVSVLVLIVLPGRIAAVGTMPSIALWMTALAAFGGPFLGRLCLLYSARHIPAALSTLMGLASPVATLALAWVVLGDWPSSQELMGGGLVLIGMGWVLRERAVPPSSGTGASAPNGSSVGTSADTPAGAAA